MKVSESIRKGSTMIEHMKRVSCQWVEHPALPGNGGGKRKR